MPDCWANRELHHEGPNHLIPRQISPDRLQQSAAGMQLLFPQKLQSVLLKWHWLRDTEVQSERFEGENTLNFQ